MNVRYYNIQKIILIGNKLIPKTISFLGQYSCDFHTTHEEINEMSEETQKNTFLTPSAAACSSSTGNMTSKYKTLQFTNDNFIGQYSNHYYFIPINELPIREKLILF